MLSLALLLRLGGVLHFGILIASALVPHVLDWKAELQKLPRLLRQLVWVHGVFIVLTIVGFGTISILYADALAAGTPLARAVCGLIAVFWLLRLAVQFWVFDASPHLTSTFLRLGYHGLTLVFLYLGTIYALSALARFLPT
jgi:hypothetical protein